MVSEQMKEKRENMTFATYYDNCVKYERTVNFNERIKMGELLNVMLNSQLTILKSIY